MLRYRKQRAFFYFSPDRKGVARDLLAISPDLFHPQKCDGVQVDVGGLGSIDEKHAHKPSVVFRNGVLYHFYCAVAKDNRRGISVAASRPVT